MWFNINYTGSSNIKHTHPGSALSGVFYINIPDNSGNITFHHIDSHGLFFTQDSTFSINPHDGLMILFPGTLLHDVEINNSKENRISIAFNIFN